MTNGRYLNLLLFLLSLFPLPDLVSQGMTWEDRRTFSDSVKTIKVWTYFGNDTSYPYIPEVMEELTIFLNQKGYQVEQLLYSPAKNAEMADWLQVQLTSLQPGEALLTFPVSLKADSIARNKGSRRSHQVIAAGEGGVFSDLQLYELSDQPDTLFFIEADATVYVSYNKTPQGAFPPAYVRNFSLDRPDLVALTYKCLNGLPRCRNPIVNGTAPKRTPQAKVPLEISFLGGGFLPSNRKTEKGSASFDPNIQYGASLGFGFSKSFDFTVNVRRETTGVTMNIPTYTDSSAVVFRITYLTLGGEYSLRVTAAVSPFAALSLGAVNLSPKSNYYREVWYFAMIGELGSKFYLNKWLGLKMQADFFYQINPKHAPFLYAPDTPLGIDDAMSNMLQIGLSAGVIFRL